VLASRLKALELKDWINRELSGYSPEDQLPEYRRLPDLGIRLTFDGPIGYPPRLQTLHPQDIPAELRVPEHLLVLRQPLADLESASSSPHGSKINLPGFWIHRYRQLIEEGQAFGFGLLAMNGAEIRIPAEVFESVVSSIRFHALKLATTIEELNLESASRIISDSQYADARQQINHYVLLNIYDSGGGPIENSSGKREQHQNNFNSASSLSLQGDENSQSWTS